MDSNVKNNYKIVSSDIYIVANTVGAQLNNFIDYNTPTLIPTHTGPTSYTFVSGDQRPLTYLGGWLDTLTKNQTVPNFFTFADRNNRLSFGRNLLSTDIGGGVEEDPWYGMDTTTNILGSEDTISSEYITSPIARGGNDAWNFIRRGRGGTTATSTPSPTRVTFTNFEAWAVRCVGPQPQFVTKTIIYDVYNQFNGFLVDPNYQLSVMNSQYVTGIAPIQNTQTDYLTTTRGQFSTYTATQTGSSLTSFTSTYSGYTNLSAFTDSIGRELSADDVFDIEMSGDYVALSTTLPMSDRMAASEGNFINEEVDKWIATISSDALYTNCGPFTPTRTPTNYASYVAPEDMCISVKLTTSIFVSYIDEGWFDYVSAYRSLTNNTFPSNDYQLTSLINSAIINGNSNKFTPYDTLEGPLVSEFWTETYFAAYGLHPHTGIEEFEVEINLRQQFSGTTSGVTLATYTLGANPTNNPNCNDYLTLPVNPTYKKMDTYTYSGTSATTNSSLIFESTYTAGLESGVINLGKGDTIVATLNINAQSSTKSVESGSTATTLTIRVGSDMSNEMNIRYPWMLFRAEDCNPPVLTREMIWEPDRLTQIPTPIFSNGKRIVPTPSYNQGSLTLVDPRLNTNTEYIPPVINLQTLNELPYLDLSAPINGEYNFENLTSINKRKNNWVKLLEEGKVEGWTINAPKVVSIDKRDQKIEVTLPVPVNGAVTTLFSPQYTFILYTVVKVKGTQKTFPLVEVFTPTTLDDLNKPTIGSYLDELVGDLEENITDPTKIEDLRVENKGNTRIINLDMVMLKPSAYDIVTPTTTSTRNQYCKCGENSYLQVPQKSNQPCEAWCCARGADTYYPCSENEMTPAKWVEMIGKDFLMGGGSFVNKSALRGVVRDTGHKTRLDGGGSQVMT